MSRSVPLIGVTTYYANATWGAFERKAGIVPASYFELVAGAGARPLLLPPLRHGTLDTMTGAREVIRVLDGLVVIGGGDVDPALYGEATDPTVAGVDSTRDASEVAYLEAALEVDLPVLCICRGLQLLNVLLGGSLHQHLPAVVGHDAHRVRPGEFGPVEIETVPGTKLAGIVGDHDVVRCAHHQAIDQLGEGLVIAARSALPQDVPGPGVIEGAELTDRHFVVGVQWHPEEAGDPRLFKALIAAVES
jgi:putative glutamine amidotransferase